MSEYEPDLDEPDSDDPEWFEWFTGVVPVDLVERLLAAVASDEEGVGDELRELDADWFPVAWTLALLIRGVHNGEPASVDLVNSLLQLRGDG